jgi:heat shock protein HtpX
MSANAFRTAALLGLLSGLLLLIGTAVGGQQGLIVAFGFAVAFNFASYWFSDRIVLAMYKAKEVGPGHPLHSMVQRLAQRAGLPMPKVYIIPTASPNAFATGRNPEHASVAATEGIMQALDERELEGVMAHELAHVKHRDILIASVAATIAAAIMMVARMAFFFGGSRDGDRGGSPIVGIAMLILAPIAAMLIQAAISRQREFGADAGGAEISGNPQGLASALQKIEAYAKRAPLQVNPATAQATQHMFIIAPFRGQQILSLFSTHPPTEQRVARLMGR